MTAPFTVQQQAALPSRPLPIVSIGLGGIVHDAHYPAYRLAGFPVAGGYDLNPERARFMQQTFDLPQIYDTLEEAIACAPPEAVFDVAVPGSAVLDILRHLPDGRAVLIQKPMGETLAEARAIRDLCRQKRLTAAVNFQMRFAPYILAARSMIEQGLIGDLWDIEVRMQVYMPWGLWPFLRGKPRLEILYHSIHYVDLVRSFLGDPAAVYAKTLRHPTTPELASTRTTIILDYGETVRVNILTNHAHIYGPSKQESYVKWEGSKGAVQVRAGLNMDYPKGRPDLFEYVLLDDGPPPETWQTLPIQGSWFPEAFIGTMASLQRYVLGESSTLPTAVEDAYRTMAVVEAAYQSSESGGTPIPL
jgi:predicted dehydrogenase